MRASNQFDREKGFKDAHFCLDQGYLSNYKVKPIARFQLPTRTTAATQSVVWFGILQLSQRQ